MADIVERIIFDDSQAIPALNNIAKHTETIQKGMQSMNNESQKALENMSKKAQESTDKTNNAISKTIQKNREAGKSFSDMVRPMGVMGGAVAGVIDKLNEYRSIFGKFMSDHVNWGRLSETNKQGVEALTRAFGGGSKAITIFAKSLNIMKSALLATGIGALLVAVGSLVAFFTRTQEGMDKIKTASAGLGAAWRTLTDKAGELGGKIVKAFEDPKKAVSDLWNAIKENLVNRLEAFPLLFTAIGGALKSLFSADWDGLKNNALGVGSAITQMTLGLDKEQQKGILELGKNMVDAATAAAALEKQFIALNRERAKFSVTEANLEAQVQAYRETSRDTSKALKERIKASLLAAETDDKIDKQKIAFAQRELNLIKQRNALRKENDKDLQAEYEAESKLGLLRAENSRENIMFNRTINSLQKEAIGQLEDMKDEIIEIAKAKNLISDKEEFNMVKDEQINKLKEYLAKLKDIGETLNIDVSKETNLGEQIIKALEERTFQEEVNRIPTIKIKGLILKPTTPPVIKPGEKAKFDYEDWFNNLEGFDDLWRQFLEQTFDLLPEDAEKLAKGLNVFVNEWGSILTEATDIQLANIDKTLAKITERKDKAKADMEEERELYEQGLANNYEATKQNVDNILAEETRLNTQKEKLQKQAEKRQLIADTVQQTSSLITSSINIIQGFSKIPIVGLGLGIAAVASLLAFFAKTKIDAFKATKLYTGAERISDHFGYGVRGGDSDLPGSTGKGYRLVNERTGHPTNVIISGNEMLIPEKVSKKNAEFFQNLRMGLYDGIDLSSAIGYHKTYKLPKTSQQGQNTIITNNNIVKQENNKFLIEIEKGKYLVYELQKDQGHGSIIKIQNK